MPDDLARSLAVTEMDDGLAFSGEIDCDSVRVLGPMLDPLPGDAAEVRLDLAAVTFIDSSGLRLLIQAHQRAETSGRSLVLERPSPSVARLLDISGLRDHLIIRDDFVDG
ncbi:MAG: STAS domain-containing protein [Acidimicrobiia bacterium]